LGTILALFIGLFIEPLDDENLLWKTMNFYLPISILIIMTCALFFVVRHDSLKFLIVTDDINEAKIVVSEIYSCQNVYNLIHNLRLAYSEDTSSQTVIHALFSSKYYKATWFNAIYIIFNKMVGFEFVMEYANMIFDNNDYTN
jgi:hypothetical protein